MPNDPTVGLGFGPPKLGAEPKLGAAGADAEKLGALVPKLVGVEPNVEAPLGEVVRPPLFAPPNFSCVRPHAARPSTAPMAIWNNPAP